MALPREFVAYLAKQVVKRLLEAKLIQIEQPEYVLEVISQVMLDEVLIEDKINDEVRRILEEHGNEMKQMGASYEEMFKKVKKQIVRDRQVIL
ncbi:MAG: DUF507 family protein [Acidobacteria bacterium]|nr:DUF507 family protein [Acidobacteriota bacterium]